VLLVLTELQEKSKNNKIVKPEQIVDVSSSETSPQENANRIFCHRKSQKFKQLKSKFKKMKRKAMQTFYSEFVSELKMSDPGKWYTMAKKIGVNDQMSKDDIQVESLAGIENENCAQIIAEHFEDISNQYLPIDTSQLPCYLPAQRPTQVDK
jgi:hypothetical protein